jgi:hypothetical protein
MTVQPETEGVQLTEDEKLRRSRRNKAIAIAVAGLCVLFYVITIFKMGPAILARPM